MADINKKHNMRIAVGCDHAGFILKKLLIHVIQERGHDVIDLGTDSLESVDYPDFAEKVGNAIITGEADRGILVCGSGVGVSIAANKIHGIYAGVCHDSYSAAQGVEHDHMNVLCLGSRIIGEQIAKDCVTAFLNAYPSDEPRHLRRVGKIHAIEGKY